MATTLKENVTVEMHTFTAEDARGILHRTGCKVQVRSRGGGPRILTITGAPEQVMAARSQALNILAGLHPLRAPLLPAPLAPPALKSVPLPPPLGVIPGPPPGNITKLISSVKNKSDSSVVVM